MRMTRAESKAATRTELIAAARRVFVERGYHGASLELVAGEAGYSKGAVYSAFGSKGRMFLAVYERELEQRLDAVRGWGADPHAGSREWFSRVRAEPEWTLALLEFRLHAARDPELNAAYAERHEHYLAGFAEAIGRTLQEARTMISLGNGFALEQLAAPGDDLEAMFTDAAVRLAS
jgi:AcrR family transcriptional regulator